VVLDPTLTAVKRNPWLRAFSRQLISTGKPPQVALLAHSHEHATGLRSPRGLIAISLLQRTVRDERVPFQARICFERRKSWHFDTVLRRRPVPAGSSID
jgi:hypothetical protein